MNRPENIQLTNKSQLAYYIMTRLSSKNLHLTIKFIPVPNYGPDTCALKGSHTLMAKLVNRLGLTSYKKMYMELCIEPDNHDPFELDPSRIVFNRYDGTDAYINCVCPECLGVKESGDTPSMLFFQGISGLVIGESGNSTIWWAQDYDEFPDSRAESGANCPKLVLSDDLLRGIAGTFVYE